MKPRNTIADPRLGIDMSNALTCLLILGTCFIDLKGLKALATLRGPNLILLVPDISIKPAITMIKSSIFQGSLRYEL